MIKRKIFSGLLNTIYDIVISGSWGSGNEIETNENIDPKIDSYNNDSNNHCNFDDEIKANESIDPEIDFYDNDSHDYYHNIFDKKKRKKREKVDEETIRVAEIFLKEWTGKPKKFIL